MLPGGTALKTISMRTETDPIGLGIITRSELLAKCETTMRSRDAFELRLMRGVSFDDLVARCRTIAETIALGSPNFSLALAVAADAASHQQDWSSMSGFLAASQHSAPNEQRLGQYRLRIAEMNLSHLTPAARQSYNADLGLQIVSNRGIFHIAQKYLDDDAFRSRVATVLSEMGDADQRRFVQALRGMLPQTAQ